QAAQGNRGDRHRRSKCEGSGCKSSAVEWRRIQELCDLAVCRNGGCALAEVTACGVGKEKLKCRRLIVRIGDGQASVYGAIHFGIDSSALNERRCRDAGFS